MSNVRLISDYHFGHKFMAQLRGFKTTDEMNNHIIEEHNKVVNKKDLTYILGDISMHDPTYYPLLDKMNGRKRIIMGNHDDMKDAKELMKYCEQLGALFKYKGIFISHCPVHPSELEYRVQYNIHGHTHENFMKADVFELGKGYLPDKRYINVCCEVQNYKPKLLKELIPNYDEYIKSRKK